MNTIGTSNLNMIHIKGGTFVQSSSFIKIISSAWNEYPGGDHRKKPIYHAEVSEFVTNKRNVTLNDFVISKELITIAQWNSVMKTTNSSSNEEQLKPITNVTLEQIHDFISKLEAPNGQIYDLPSIAQLEYLYKTTKEISFTLREISKDYFQQNLGTDDSIDPCSECEKPKFITILSDGSRSSAKTDCAINGGFRLILRACTPAEQDRINYMKNLSESNKSKLCQGALSGIFSISESKGVRFSMGNLQFNPSKYEFRFASKQWETIGAENSKIASNYDGWIDLFEWGTSGYMGKQPYGSGFQPSKDSGNKDIADTDYDWGQYNPITNGGNKEGLWRTLTSAEWKYIVNRPNLHVPAKINGVNGIILLPDNFWEQKVRIPLNTSTYIFDRNNYSIDQWTILENAGAVFLPVTGMLDWHKTFKEKDCGHYWSATCRRLSDLHAYILFIKHNGTIEVERFEDYYSIHNGYSVRLVQDFGICIPNDANTQARKDSQSNAKIANPTPTINLEELISAALVDGVVTDKERAILIKKVTEAGGDIDEFEMLLDARIYEVQQKMTISAPKPESKPEPKPEPKVEPKDEQKAEPAKSAEQPSGDGRAYWVQAINEDNMKFVDAIFTALVSATGCEFAPNYTQSYIGASLNGKNSHLINVKQGKKGLRISTQVKQTAAIDSTLKSLAIDGDVTYGSDGWYVFFVTNKIDIDKLVSVLKQSAVERGYLHEPK